MTKRKHTTKKKAFLALAAIRGDKTINQLSSLYQIHPNQIKRWKDVIEKEAEILFADKRKKENWDKDRIIDELHRIIGQREVEIEWLKKKFNIDLPREERPHR